MAKTLRQLVIDQLEFRETAPVPYAGLAFCEPVARALDEHYGSDAWRAAVHNAIRSCAALRLQPHDGTRKEIYTDEYGVTWRTGTGAMHLESAPLAEPSLRGLKLPSLDQLLPDEALEDVNRQVAEQPEHFTVAGMGFGLFERIWTLRGMENLLLDVAAEPAFFEDLAAAVADHQLAIVARLAQTSIDGVWFSDDWGDQRGVIIGPRRWRRVLKPHLARMYEAVRKAGKYRISHCCGNVADVVEDLIEIGLNCLESVQPEAMDPYELKRRFAGRMAFCGGLGSQSTIPFASPAEIRRAVERLCRELGAGGGYILGPAKTVLEDTPVANAAAVLEAFNEQLDGAAVT